MRISDWSSDVCSSDLVGKQSVEFIHNADGFIVRTHARITVTFLSMTIYRFEHDAVETWANGRLTNFVRLAERRVGKEWVIKFSSWWSTYLLKKQYRMSM